MKNKSRASRARAVPCWVLGREKGMGPIIGNGAPVGEAKAPCVRVNLSFKESAAFIRQRLQAQTSKNSGPPAVTGHDTSAGTRAE